ncbi:aspartate/glutamate racemase family protein [Miniphocaeibacter massiliensis]|uniref:aspartate/glutamate racemase family protein n=1 Tax=Miniphocaeibacter massiliensis TaxID=2041841 RepID=UPI000C1B9096|nr:aspartate/glutamate racemase family protein [Miniphocaeibacter massiliensis]
MKTIGLIGGMSWESTVEYYSIINNTVKEIKGGLNSAEILLYSVNFKEIEEYQSNNQWDKAEKLLTDIAKNLEYAGADFIVICTNTMHKVADKIQGNIGIPIIHIADSTIEKLKENRIKKVGLLGTKYTIKEDFYKSRIENSGIDIIVPKEEDIEIINKIIFEELCKGVIKEDSKNKYLEIIEKLVEGGAEGIILGCTEIGLLINQEDTNIKLYDTTIIHAKKAAELSLK